MKKLSRTPNLDLIRGIAILLVLFDHVFERYDYPRVNFFISSGRFGVQLFFVLSGFLIGCLFYQELNKNNEVNIKRFILRRFSRTLPTYYMILFIAFLIVYLARHEVFNVRYLFFLQNYMEQIPFFKVSWSLCVEEHFYLVLPFFLTFLNFIKSKWFKIFIVVIVLLLPITFRIIESEGQSLGFGYLTTATHLNFDSMSFGVLMAYLYINSNVVISNFLKKVFIISPIFLLILFPFLDERMVYTFGKMILPLSFSLCILVFVMIKQYKISSNKITSYIAESSYAIYLTHAFVLNFFDKIYTHRGFNIFVDLLVIAITIFTSLFIGFLFYYFIEKKIMFLRAKWVAK